MSVFVYVNLLIAIIYRRVSDGCFGLCVCLRNCNVCVCEREREREFMYMQCMRERVYSVWRFVIRINVPFCDSVLLWNKVST